MENFVFRLVVRGTNAEGARVRRCRVQRCPSYEAAWEAFADRYAEMVTGLSDPSYAVLPPVGWKIDGTVSKGYEVAS